MAPVKGRRAACSWSALDNATAMLSWPRLPWWSGPRAASPLAAGVHLATQQPCHRSQGSGQPWAQALGNATALQWLHCTWQRSNLECTWQRSSLAIAAKAPGSHGHRLLATQQPCNGAQAAGLHLAAKQACHGGQGYRQPGTMQPSCKQPDVALQHSNLARLIIATGSQAPCSEATGRGLATQQPCHGGQGSG